MEAPRRRPSATGERQTKHPAQGRSSPEVAGEPPADAHRALDQRRERRGRVKDRLGDQRGRE
jgi:hypothetical protein